MIITFHKVPIDMSTLGMKYVAVLDKFKIIIKNVPCQECVQCGERYYSDDVMQNIEAIVKKAIDVQSEFFVTEYSSVA